MAVDPRAPVLAGWAATVNAGLKVAGGVGYGGDPGEASFDAEARLLPGMDRASLFGGRGRLVGTAGGVLLLAPVENVFTLMHVSGFYQDLVRGAVIVAAVAVSSRKD